MGTKWPPRIHAHGASGQDRVSWRGKHYYLGKSGTPESKKRYAELLARLATEPDPALEDRRRRTGLTVSEALDQWLAHAKERYAGNKEFCHHKTACLVAMAVHGGVAIADFGAKELDDVREAMIARGWSRGVIQHQLTRIRTGVRWLERRGLAPRGSWGALRALETLPASDRRVRTLPERKPCTWPQVAGACRHVLPVVRDMLLVQWFTGMRSGELRQMRAGEVDQAEWVYRPARHKNSWRGHAREVAIGPRARAVLARRLQGLEPGDYVFPSSPGKCYGDSAYAKAITTGCERAGVERFTGYACRHSWRVRVTRELSLDHARAGMGHRSVMMSAKYAAGVDLRAAIEAARRVG